MCDNEEQREEDKLEKLKINFKIEIDGLPGINGKFSRNIRN